MSYPLIAPVNGRRTSSFGPRDTGIPGATRYHYGVDVGANPRGSKPDVLSPVAGTVLAVQRSVVDARGRYVIITGPDADFLVQHLDSIPSGIRKGKKVRIGRKIGVMGNSAKRPAGADPIAIHLHFEVHPHTKAGRANSLDDILRARTAVDPEKFYRKYRQPFPWQRPGEGVTMTPKFKSRHLRLVAYEHDRKTVFKYRKAGFKIKTLSTWRGWTITKAGKFYATARLKKA